MKPQVILCSAIAAVSVMLGCREYTQIGLTPQTTIVSRQWKELRPTAPLKWAAPQQELVFHIDSPHDIKVDGPNVEIMQPDGNRSVPEVWLVANNGQTYLMDGHGFWGEDMFFTVGKPIRDATIIAFRIRNDFSIQISNPRWVGYDPARVKR